MVRTVSMLALAAGLLTTAAGCRHCCGTTSYPVAAQSGPACCDGVAGVPVSGGMVGPGGVPAMVVPGVAPTEGGLPYPQPTEYIPRQGVPVPSAVPLPAPGDPTAGVLPPPKMGVPVKGNR